MPEDYSEFKETPIFDRLNKERGYDRLTGKETANKPAETRFATFKDTGITTEKALKRASGSSEFMAKAVHKVEPKRATLVENVDPGALDDQNVTFQEFVSEQVKRFRKKHHDVERIAVTTDSMLDGSVIVTVREDDKSQPKTEEIHLSEPVEVKPLHETKIFSNLKMRKYDQHVQDMTGIESVSICPTGTGAYALEMFCGLYDYTLSGVHHRIAIMFPDAIWAHVNKDGKLEIVVEKDLLVRHMDDLQEMRAMSISSRKQILNDLEQIESVGRDQAD